MIFFDFESFSKDQNSKSTIWKRNRSKEKVTINKRTRSNDAIDDNEFIVNELLSDKSG